MSRSDADAVGAHQCPSTLNTNSAAAGWGSAAWSGWGCVLCDAVLACLLPPTHPGPLTVCLSPPMSPDEPVDGNTAHRGSLWGFYYLLTLKGF